MPKNAEWRAGQCSVKDPDPSTGVTKINVECIRTVKADLKGEKKDSQVLIKKSGELKTPFQRQKSDPKSWWGFFFFEVGSKKQ